MTFLIAALFFAPLEWFFEYRENKPGIYLTKPLVMIFLLAWLWVSVDVPTAMLDFDASAIMWFILGLSFCLGGDVFLMFQERFFLLGLIMFLLGHFFYIVGFEHVIPPSGSEVASLMIAVVLVLLSGWVYVRLASGMRKSGMERMRIPVLIYSIVISLMLYSALLTLFDPNWEPLSAIFVSVGASLFLISDIMNAWLRFVRPLKGYRVWIMSTYHLAQIGITVGVTLHFSSLIV